jgi:hypothetical protein
MKTRNNATNKLRDCGVWRVIPIPDNKIAAASPLCNSLIEQPYPLAVCKARHRVEAASSHLRDCVVCECFSTLIGKIGINVIYMYRVESTLQTTQSRNLSVPDERYFLALPVAGTKRREIPLGSDCWAEETLSTDQRATLAASPVFLASVQPQPCARRRQSGGRGVQLARIPQC